MESGEKIILDRDLRPVTAGVDSTDTTQIINFRLKPATKRLMVDSELTDGLNIGSYDYVSVAYPTTSREVYIFKNGGINGSIIATVTLQYTDSLKDNLSSVEET